MKKIKINLPILNYQNCDFSKKNNVSYENRSVEFEKQNQMYIKAGFTEFNTEYYQSFSVGPDITDFASTIFPRFSVSVMKQCPGQTLPLHDDTFFMFASKNGIDPERCVRVNIFLEDWQSGHYFEINNQPILQWNKGDAIIIERGELHLSGNMGLHDKFTMQITGVWDELKRS